VNNKHGPKSRWYQDATQLQRKLIKKLWRRQRRREGKNETVKE